MVKVIRITKKEGKLPGMKERERGNVLPRDGGGYETSTEYEQEWLLLIHEKTNKLDSSN